MKTVKNRRFGLLALLLMATPFWGTPASATAQFEQTEVSNPENFIVVAAPAGRIGYGLMILEQVKDDRPCWGEVPTGAGLTLVDPLLTQFDFTGICGRSIDSNGYSVRTAGEELGLQYSLRVLRQGNDLVLVAAANRLRNVNVPIGRTYGLPQPGQFARIYLDPGWRLARRVFNGRPTGHLYVTNDQPVSVLLAAANSPTATAGPISPPALPEPQTPSNSPLLPPPGSTSPITEVPASEGTAQPAPTDSVQIPVPQPGSPRANLPPMPPRRATENPAPSALPAPPTETAANPAPVNIPVEVPVDLPTEVPAEVPTNVPTNVPVEVPVEVPASQPEIPAPNATATPSPVTPPVTVPQQQARGIVFGYRVIVAADSAEMQDQVRSLAPQTQIVEINGQPAVQAGLFRDLNSAEQLKQRLEGENLSVTIVPIR
ncbi:DUF3747 domain-containing protein [Leptolyngbya ohadii]|uniref:DUF3747 domain-containing protein n=1 Tax=Leptolyngbya ohadii TaxID=1962290 RepID=UPI000B5986CB|nr:DUF3747 domain-containing protein [Leptolyngbya ohadii]